MIIKTQLLQTYGQPFDRDGLTFEVDVTESKNIGELHDFLMECQGVHLYSITESNHETGKFKLSKRVVLKFRSPRDAVEAKLRLEY